MWNRKSNERGNSSLVWYILLAPLMVVLMGYGIDTSIDTYTKNTLQQSLDQATQAAVSMAANPGYDDNTGNDVSVITPQAKQAVLDTFLRVYDENRTGQLSNLICQTQRSASVSEGNLYIPQSGCGYTIVKLNITGSGTNTRAKYLEVEVAETSKNSFLHMIGIPTQDYVLSSRAAITTAND